LKQQDLLVLIDKYVAGTASEEERDLLQQYFNSFQQTENWNEAELGERDETETRLLKRLSAAIQQQQPALVVPFCRWHWGRFAAAVLLLIGSVALWFLHTKDTDVTVAAEQPLKEQAAQKKNVTLTLSNGRVMVLDSTPDGVLASNRNTIIRKQEKIILVDVAVPVEGTQAVSTGLHLLKTPNGQQYKAVLADGSRVWLNAASSLRFPAVFAGDERRVEVSGEAYFEVAKDTARPFRVWAVAKDSFSKKGTLIEVLGTHFNITAYGDESIIKTTLLEGSVKVAVAESGNAAEANGAVLLPGEQAQIPSFETSGETVFIKRVDVEEAVAWKSNIFHFNNTGLENIMRQLARWYDVEVVYASKIPVRHFSGKISRAATLATVLEILEQSNIHFTIRGKQIIVKS
jgi:transmembrane sensor